MGDALGASHPEQRPPPQVSAAGVGRLSYLALPLSLPVITTTTTAPPPLPPPPPRPKPAPRPVVTTPPPPPAPASAGVAPPMNAQLRRIGGCESAGRPDAPINWSAHNPSSTASGGFEELDSTWRSWAVRYGSDVGASAYSRAMYAPAWVQQTVAVRAYNAQGTGSWTASRGCWG